MASFPKLALVTATIFVFSSTMVIAQDTDQKKPPAASQADASASKTQKPATEKSAKKPSITDATRVSTADAVKNAAHEATKEKPKDGDLIKGTDPGAQSDVLEFQPAAPDDAATAAANHPKVSTKSGRKTIHGDAHGALDPKNTGTHRTGGAVGATSKSGKASVYVETNQSKSTSPTPH